MLEKRDHKYMALGIMSGILTVPIGVFVTGAVIAASNTRVREVISADAPATYELALTIGDLLVNLIPLFIICALIALGLRLLPDLMIKGFMGFGRFMDIGIKLVLAFSIVEYFTGAFSALFGAWGFDAIIADEVDQFRALEIAGYIGIMLAGAFPMVYAIRTWLAKPLTSVGERLGLSVSGSAGFLASIANILAMYHLVKSMPPKDKVLNISFAVCAAFLFGDHLAFTANFQPTLIAPITLGKLTGGLLAVALAFWIALPKARELERADRADGTIAEGEYLELPVGGLEREGALPKFDEDTSEPV
jgi:ethanolamine transporter